MNMKITDLHTFAHAWEFAQHNVILVHYQSCVLYLWNIMEKNGKIRIEDDNRFAKTLALFSKQHGFGT